MDKDRKEETYSFLRANIDVERENLLLRETISQLKNEIERYREPALMIAELTDLIGEHAVIRVPNGNKFYVNISNKTHKLRAGDTVLLEQKNLTVIDKLERDTKFEAEQFVIIEKPVTSWKDIGGLDEQVQEIKEVIELPLKQPELFKKIGITPPKGILLYGPPGTGKTLLAKAVARSTNSTFIEIVASELVQKFIGEGAKLVKDIFKLARDRSPTIIFIDEIDALAAKRIDLGTSGEREVQRTFMQFLAEIDGFKNLDNVKIIGCTNRKDILDPAVIRPGRLDRLIEVPAPGPEGVKQIFKIHTRNMTFAKDLHMNKLLKLMEGFTGAEIKASVTEAGYFAMRRIEENKLIKQKDDVDKEKTSVENKLKKVTAEKAKLSQLPSYKKIWNVIKGNNSRLEAEEELLKEKILDTIKNEKELSTALDLVNRECMRLTQQINQAISVNMNDLAEAIKKVKRVEDEHPGDYIGMFG